MIQPKLLNARQAAKYLGMSAPTFYNEVAKGLIPFHQTPGKNGICASRKKYHIVDLDNYIKQYKKFAPVTTIYQNNILCASKKASKV